MLGQFPDQIKDLPLFEGGFAAHQLEGKRCKVLFASYPAGSSIDPHRHDTDNVGVVVRGEMILTVDGKTTHTATGEWYHVPAQLEHAARFEADTDAIEFWFEQ